MNELPTLLDSYSVQGAPSSVRNTALQGEQKKGSPSLKTLLHRRHAGLHGILARRGGVRRGREAMLLKMVAAGGAGWGGREGGTL